MYKIKCLGKGSIPDLLVRLVRALTTRLRGSYRTCSKDGIYITGMYVGVLRQAQLEVLGAETVGEDGVGVYVGGDVGGGAGSGVGSGGVCPSAATSDGPGDAPATTAFTPCIYSPTMAIGGLRASIEQNIVVIIVFVRQVEEGEPGGLGMGATPAGATAAAPPPPPPPPTLPDISQLALIKCHQINASSSTHFH